ncbi:MAG: hypothetical protein B7Z72_09300 [Gemmatimonadetes bacterium 21-71-4]|nr:MAG: hypothetical protein B7Z72_09300 [Gemmatimonadetes bacterium 21-71-4]
MSKPGWWRRAAPYLIAVVAGSALAWGIVAFVIFPPGAPPEDARVPNVTGLSFDAASQRLQLVGFKAQRGEMRFQEAAPRLTVLQQSPDQGSSEPLGTVVTLDLSAGARTAQVPNVVGLVREQADSALTAAGFTTVLDSAPQVSDQPLGTVVGTRPASGARATVPSVVTLVLSAGPANVTVPDLAGRSLVEARILLDQLGLTLGDVTILSGGDSRQPQAVVQQNPAAGTLAPSGARVTVSVSGGRTP